MDWCPSCQSTHMGIVPCGLTFAERLRSVVVDPVRETKTRVNYFDKSALDQTFGEDRVEHYWESTAGHGAIHRGSDGELYHRDRSGDVKVASDRVLAEVTAGQEAADVV